MYVFIYIYVYMCLFASQYPANQPELSVLYMIA